MSATMTIAPGSASHPEPAGRHPASRGRHARTAARAGYRTDSAELEALPGSVSAARARTRALLTACNLGELAGEAEVIVSELATNAIQATIQAASGARVGLTLTAGQHTLLIAVRDTIPDPPAPQAPGPGAPSGRGLLIVGALAARWGWEPAPSGGKTVWALVGGQRHA